MAAYEVGPPDKCLKRKVVVCFWSIIGAVAATLLILVFWRACGSNSRAFEAQVVRNDTASVRRIVWSKTAGRQPVTGTGVPTSSPIGLVRSTRASRLVGASVCVMLQNGEFGECTLTDADGHFALDEGFHNGQAFFASASGHLSKVQRITSVDGSQSIPTITLEPGGVELAGEVMDATGGVVAGALIRTIGPTPGAVALSDRSGRFSLTVPQGSMQVLAEAEGYSQAVKEVDAPLVGLTLVLAPASVIMGRVLAERTQAPIANAMVTATNERSIQAPPSITYTEADGSFRFYGVPAGGYQILAVSSRWRSWPGWATVGVGVIAEDVVLTAIPATTLTGVVDVAGNPCTAGTVRLTGPISIAETISETGIVRFDGLIPGAYLASISCASYTQRLNAPGDLPRSVDLTAIGGEEHLSITSEPVTRTWSLMRDTQSLLPGDDPLGLIRVSIDADGRAANAFTILVARNGAPPYHGRRKGNEFVFPGLMPGQYEVYLEQAPETKAQATIERDGQEVQVRLMAPSTTTISGRVLDTAGVPIPDAWVYASSSPAPFVPFTIVGRPTLTAEDGSFTIAGLFVGPYRITADSGMGVVERDNVTSGDQSLQLVVPSYASLSGTAEDRSGEPLQAFHITYRHQPDGNIKQVDGHSGAWFLPWLAPGTYRLVLSSNAGNASLRVVLSPGSDRRLTIRVDSSDSTQPFSILGGSEAFWQAARTE
jgi:hypothetical protein